MMSKLWKNFLSEKFEDFKISISVDEVEPEEVVVIPNDVLRTVFKLFFSHFAYIYSIIPKALFLFLQSYFAACVFMQFYIIFSVEFE